MDLAEEFGLILRKRICRIHLMTALLHARRYGHLGDGNLHLNVSAPSYDPAIGERLEPWVYEWTAARHGSISAEHGLGQTKADCIWCATLHTILYATKLNGIIGCLGNI